MVVGFNHNFRYKGELFHVQTEDGGLKSPHIITLLYKGGIILNSKKTSYADIGKVDNLDKVVEELMKEQHREMLRRLKDGDFDEIIAARSGSGAFAEKTEPAVAPAPAPPAAPPSAAAPRPAPRPAAAPKAAAPKAAAPKAAAPKAAARPAAPPAPTPPVKDDATAVETSLDEVILSYLLGEDS